MSQFAVRADVIAQLTCHRIDDIVDPPRGRQPPRASVAVVGTLPGYKICVWHLREAPFMPVTSIVRANQVASRCLARIHAIAMALGAMAG